MYNMRLIVITPPGDIPDEVPRLVSLVEAGADYIHLRKPGITTTALCHLLDALPQKVIQRCVVHQHHELIKQYPLAGVHITGADKPHADRIHALMPRYISTGCHSLDEIDALRHTYHNIMLSPVFDSVSKTDYHAAFSHNELKSYLATSPLRNKITALGGITPATLPLAQAMGFTGAAVLGYIGQQKDAQAIIKAVNMLRNSLKDASETFNSPIKSPDQVFL